MEIKEIKEFMTWYRDLPSTKSVGKCA
jgi:hypothetical protein